MGPSLDYCFFLIPPNDSRIICVGNGLNCVRHTETDNVMFLDFSPYTHDPYTHEEKLGFKFCYNI